MDYAQLFNGIVGMGLLGILLYEALKALEPRFCAGKYAEQSDTVETP